MRWLVARLSLVESPIAAYLAITLVCPGAARRRAPRGLRRPRDVGARRLRARRRRGAARHRRGNRCRPAPHRKGSLMKLLAASLRHRRRAGRARRPVRQRVPGDGHARPQPHRGAPDGRDVLRAMRRPRAGRTAGDGLGDRFSPTPTCRPRRAATTTSPHSSAARPWACRRPAGRGGDRPWRADRAGLERGRRGPALAGVACDAGAAGRARADRDRAGDDHDRSRLGRDC